MRIYLLLFVAAFTLLTLSAMAQVGHWKLDNNFADSSPNNIPSTLIGTPTFSTDSKEGTHAMNLWPSRAINLGTPASFPTGNTPRTIAAWAKTNNTSGSRAIISLGTTNAGQAMFIGQEGSALIGGGWSNSYNMMSPGFWTTGTWHHIAMTYDGTTAKLYADGVLVGSITQTYNLVISGAFIGKHLHVSGWWDGAIDDVRVYDRALSQSEIAALVSGVAAPAAPTNATASANNLSSINLAWTDNATNETGYQIEQSTQTTTGYEIIHTTAAGIQNYQVTGLSPATQYYFRIRAINGAVVSDYVEATATTPSAPQTPSGLVGHWRLDGNTQDDSGGGVTGSFIGSPTFETASKEGSHALKTNGMNQAVDLGTPAHFPTGNTPRTIAAWAKTNTLSGSHAIAAFGTTSAGQAMFIGQNGSDLIGGGWSTSYDMTAAGFWTLDTWHHICLTYDGGTARLYADGILIASNTKAYNLVLSNAFIGKHLHVSGWWNGSIDDVRIYDRALTLSEVQQLANVGPAIPAAPTNLSATAVSPTQINLSWADNANNETGVRIERSLSSGSDFEEILTTATDVTSFNDTGRTPGTTYYYRVRSVGTGGSSPYTAVVSATTPASPTGPVAHWMMNNNLSDGSGGGRSGTMVGGGTFSTTRKEGSHSLSLNGSAQYVNITNDAGLPSGTAPRSLSAWAMTNSTSGSGYRWVVAYGNDAPGQAMYIGLQGSDLKVGAYGAAHTFHFGGAWSEGEWKHVCLTYDGTTAKVYINGFEEASQAMAWNLVIDDFFIGKQVNNTPEYWNGLIDDVRIYDRVLNASEIMEIVSSRSFEPPSNLSATNVGSEHVNLLWDDNSEIEAGFEIQRARSLAGPFISFFVGADETSFVNRGLEKNGTYFYRIRAVGGEGVTQYSNTIQVTTLPSVDDDVEVQVLKDIFESLGGQSWINRTNWPSGVWPSNLTNEDFSQWYGVYVEDGDIVNINLDVNGLSGSIPPSLGNLTSLQILSMSHNNISGLIPSNLSGAVHLKTIRLDNNDLTGEIPSEIFTLQELIALQLQNNSLNGEITSSLAQLSQLHNLALSNNQLSGNILQYLTHMPYLVHLDLRNNFFHGEFPEEFANHQRLVYILLGDNFFSGRLPEAIGTIKALHGADFSHNFFSGSIPFTLNSLTDLYSLRLDHNQFSGAIPFSVGEMPRIDQLNLGYNGLTGEIPTSLGASTSLYSLDVSNNSLTGNMPNGFGTLGRLVIDNNEITELPDFSSLGNPNLRQIHASNNLISEIPASMTTMRLDFFDISGNRLSDFRENVFSAGGNLDVSKNFLDFSSLEHLKSHSFSTFNYSPQRPIEMPERMFLKEGEILLLTCRPAGQYSRIFWERLDGNLWTDVTHLDEDAESKVFKISNISANQAGFYRWRMTNSFVPGLIIESTPIEVTLNDPLVWISDQYAFQYRYDDLGRLIKKKMPGTDWVFMVYDDRDRLVMTQDGNQRNHKDDQGNGAPQWMWTKYDQLNRPIMTGIYTHDEPLDQLEMSELISSTVFHETRISDQLSHGYTKNVFHHENFIQENFEVLTVTYYDDRSYVGLIRKSDGTQDHRFGYSACEIDGQYFYSGSTCGEKVSFPGLKGLVTATKAKLLRTDDWLWTVNHYDDRNRIVQSISHNIQGTTDRSTTVYNFNGSIKHTRTTHFLDVVQQKFEYDHAGRLVRIWHGLGLPPEFKILVENEYNELGQLVTKKLHSEDGGTAFKQEVDYGYNIRGWLTKVNDPANVGNDLFAMELKYNNPTLPNTEAQFNGNISQIDWKSTDGEGQQYSYAYDPMNRLLEAKYFNQTSPNKNKRFDEKIWNNTRNAAYDLNGNILGIRREGKIGENALGSATYGLMDNLNYYYMGNKLLRVTDAVTTNSAGFKDGTNTDNDYFYDDNGNMTVDKNKGINATETGTGNSEITYNYLNLPEIVRKKTGEYIKYIYDATGRKLQQEVYDASNTLVKKSIYGGDFFYENESPVGSVPTLKFINTEEGRVVMTGSSPEYQYHLKDHLGNVRVTFSALERVETFIATMETTEANAEQAEFLRYDESTKVTARIFDHTHRDGARATKAKGKPVSNPEVASRLSGIGEERYGLAKSIRVMPGDKIRMEVFAKYVDPNKSDWQANFSDVVSAVRQAGPPPALDGALQRAAGASSIPLTAMLTKAPGGNAPKAYLNYVMYDNDFNPITDPNQTNYIQVSEAAKENGRNSNHERLYAEVEAKQAGYMYIYLSNDNYELQGEQVDVFFDDFQIQQVHSKVVQSDDYYPFGLTFNSYKRENSVPNMYQYNGKEKQGELDLGWIDYGWRQYQPETGRWNSTDPYSEKYYSYSPFAYTLNNPINLIDPDGREVEDPDEHKKCKNCNEGRIVVLYSPQQANKIKEALADSDWDEVMRIVDYASSNGFVDGNGNSSTYIYRKICDCEGNDENGFSQGSSLLISEDQGGREYINFFGVSIGEDGEAKFNFLGTKDFEKEKFNAWKDRYVKTLSTEDYNGLTQASRDLLMNRRIAGPRSDSRPYVNAGIGTNGGWSNTRMPHDGVVKMTEFFQDYKNDPQKYQQLVRQYVQYLQEVSKK